MVRFHNSNQVHHGGLCRYEERGAHDHGGFWQEAGDKLRVTGISPGFVQTNLADSVTNPEVKAHIVERSEKMGIPPAAIARAIAFAIEQPANVDVGEIIVRPTAQA